MGVRLQRDLGTGMSQIGGHGSYVGTGDQSLRGNLQSSALPAHTAGPGRPGSRPPAPIPRPCISSACSLTGGHKPAFPLHGAGSMHGTRDGKIPAFERRRRDCHSMTRCPLSDEFLLRDEELFRQGMQGCRSFLRPARQQEHRNQPLVRQKVNRSPGGKEDRRGAIEQTPSLDAEGTRSIAYHSASG